MPAGKEGSLDLGLDMLDMDCEPAILALSILNTVVLVSVDHLAMLVTNISYIYFLAFIYQSNKKLLASFCISLFDDFVPKIKHLFCSFITFCFLRFIILCDVSISFYFHIVGKGHLDICSFGFFWLLFNAFHTHGKKIFSFHHNGV